MSTTTQTSDAVKVDGLTIGYRRRGQMLRVISDVSFTIGRGEAYGLVGESGCGKTTVALAIMRYLPANAVVESGKILFDGGEDVLTASESTLRKWRGERVAMVYQDPGSALNPSLKVGQQVAEVYRHHRGTGTNEALAAAAAMLEKVRVADPQRILRRYPHQLSGGQQQRVMIAMALATNPGLLVLDEPTTGLDATVEAEVLDLVEQLRDEFDASILFISHNLGMVARICERVGVLYAGRLVEEGRAVELFKGPRHPYTLGLLRCAPRFGMHKDKDRLDPIPGSLPPLGADIPGCVYADRCPIARDRCGADPPALEPVAHGHLSRCHYVDEVSSIPVPVAPAEVGRAARSSNGDVVLRVEDLLQVYRSGGHEVAAVAGVSLDVRRGEVFGLVGESGSGKSSLARCIVGLVDATGGRISFDGRELSRAERRRDTELRRQLQMIFQHPDTALNPRHSIRRSLSSALRFLAGMRRGPERDQRMGELASSVRLEQRHLDVRPSGLSGGLKQRVAIARAFAGQPAMVLCDEPVSALDVSVQAAILNLLVDLQGSGVSYVFISHDLAIVRYLADRIGVMYLGWLVDVGLADAVFDPPHHPYTEALVSAIGTIDPGAARQRIKLRGPLPSPTNPPTGCRFHTRCHRYLGDVCRNVEPPWQRDGDGHEYRCHIPPDTLRELQASDREGD